MKIILVGLKNKENLKLLENFLSHQFTINKLLNDYDLNDYFDMVILDKYNLNKYLIKIREIKKRKRFLPIIFLSFQSNRIDFDSFKDSIDDIITIPVSKWELIFRIKKLINLNIGKESELKYKKLLEGSSLGVAVIENNRLISNNEGFLNILNLKIEEVIDKKIDEVFNFNDRYISNKITDYIKSNLESIQFDKRLVINGNEKYLNIKLSTSQERDKEKYVFMIILDIMQNINTIDEIEFLNKHDKLTGLYNREFLDYYLNEIENNTSLPISIIMGDIDGLKLINDGFGHKKGDEAIVNVSRIIEESCRKSDKVFRVGGDEFLVILPNTPTEPAKNVIKRINSLITNNNQLNYSISLGLSTKFYSHENIQSLIVKAENRMYQNKLLNDESHRHSIIESLEKVLIENTNETHDHAVRMKDMVNRMVDKLDLDSSLSHELELLARLHDIGKVSIPETILKKTSALSKKEWEIIKDHPAAGFRITKAIPNLAGVSYDILCHHEHWNGKGYPQGLKEKEIPFAARIISILDAYDVMTHERSYKKAFSKEKAIDELKRCSGFQFDPELVKVFLETL